MANIQQMNIPCFHCQGRNEHEENIWNSVRRICEVLCWLYKMFQWTTSLTPMARRKVSSLRLQNINFLVTTNDITDSVCVFLLVQPQDLVRFHVLRWRWAINLRQSSYRLELSQLTSLIFETKKRATPPSQLMCQQTLHRQCYILGRILPLIAVPLMA